MSGALNIFKTVTANLTTVTTSVYSTPLGYATVVLMAQVANTGNSTIQIAAELFRSGNTTALVQGISVPASDAIGLLTGRLIMNFGDSLDVYSSDNTSGQLTLSILETLVG